MKINTTSISIIILVICSSSLLSADNKYIVTANKGLYIRSSPDKAASIITIIPFNEEIIVVKQSSNCEIINGIKSPWFFIKYKKYSGWAFGGFLNKISASTDNVINITSSGIGPLKMGDSFDKFLQYIKHDNVIINDDGTWTLFKNNSPLIKLCDKMDGKSKIVIWVDIYSNIFKLNGKIGVGDPIDELLNYFPCKEVYYDEMKGEPSFIVTDYYKLNQSFGMVDVVVKSNEKNNPIIIDKTSDFIKNGKTNKFHRNGVVDYIYIHK
jgi:hypothetical protein